MSEHPQASLNESLTTVDRFCFLDKIKEKRDTINNEKILKYVHCSLKCELNFKKGIKFDH